MNMRNGKLREGIVSETIRVGSGYGGLYFLNQNTRVALSVGPSRKSKKFLVRLDAPDRKEHLATDTNATWSRVVFYLRDTCLGAKNEKAAVRAFARINPVASHK